MSDTVTQNPSVIMGQQHVDIPDLIGEIPGMPDQAPPDDVFSGGQLSPPVAAADVINAAKTSGAVMAVSHAVAHGTTGIGFDIVPRGSGIKINDPKSWSQEERAQRDRLEVFVQTGYRGEGHYSLRDGFYPMSHDRFMFGWGGFTIIRSSAPETKGLPPPPIALSRLEAIGAKFTKPDRTATPVPVPVALSDGRVLWVEVPRFFRRIVFKTTDGKQCWFKQLGDWRAMDSRTGKYATNSSCLPSTKAGQPGTYVPGTLPSGAVPALEVAHFATSFPGVAPYGFSGWHAELTTVASAAEHISLLLAYLKSGLHSVILAAADRPFEAATADAAIAKIDELGRGRNGLGALITIALTPTSSSSQGGLLGQSADERGRVVLHELNTKLPESLLDETLSDALWNRIASSERIPGLLIGRSDGYNFATAAAAWMTTNRLRFAPHHLEHEAFLDSLLIEMGITAWRLKTVSPYWEEPEPLTGISSVVGQNGGISVNKAMEILASVTGIDPVKVEAWWGGIPLPLVTLVLGAADPQATLDSLELPGKPQIALKPAAPPVPSPGAPVDQAGDVAAPIVEALKQLEARVEARLVALRHEPTS